MYSKIIVNTPIYFYNVNHCTMFRPTQPSSGAFPAITDAYSVQHLEYSNIYKTLYDVKPYVPWIHGVDHKTGTRYTQYTSITLKKST